jgi:hypothetical protein
MSVRECRHHAALWWGWGWQLGIDAGSRSSGMTFVTGRCETVVFLSLYTADILYIGSPGIFDVVFVRVG